MRGTTVHIGKAPGPRMDLVTQLSIRHSTELKMLGKESLSPSDPRITELGKTFLLEFFWAFITEVKNNDVKHLGEYEFQT